MGFGGGVATINHGAICPSTQTLVRLYDENSSKIAFSRTVCEVNSKSKIGKISDNTFKMG